ncbi:hypothetical protein AAFF_G00217150 [Aldrovandia affinis]|uniref:Uncharacterized protein n=1 Tax=Aldrovandia affinis TaxID=143900 RepID=A0AAD7SXI4_9TELE|nr:hypothetical protein AAFF_G00217150 [Aldrovandia affinis]
MGSSSSDCSPPLHSGWAEPSSLSGSGISCETLARESERLPAAVLSRRAASAGLFAPRASPGLGRSRSSPSAGRRSGDSSPRSFG